MLRAHLARLCAEADALHRADPGFDLDSALRDPAFVRLTAPDVGVPVADAWYALLDAGAEGRVERGEAELLLPDRDVDVALCGFRLLAESYPEYVSYKEMNDYGK